MGVATATETVRKLNLGCGSDLKPGEEWLNVDIDPTLGPDQVVDLNRALPWPTGHFGEVYCCHVLEHVPFWDQLLGECFRVLAPWGKLIVRVPDFEYALRLYLTGDKPGYTNTQPRYGSPKPIDAFHLIWGEVWDGAAGRGHCMGFSWCTDRPNDLYNILEGHEFKMIQKVHTGLKFEIAVEARKP